MEGEFSECQDQLASLERHAHLTRCFSALAELLVTILHCHAVRCQAKDPPCKAATSARSRQMLVAAQVWRRA